MSKQWPTVRTFAFAVKDSYAAHVTRPTPSVSVIIPVGGFDRYLAEQLSALTEQDYPGPVEVIVSDNRGDPRLAERVHGLAATVGPPVRYVDSARLAGAAHARNEGARVAAHDFLAFCDADDVVRPGWISSLVELAQNADVVGTALDASRINCENALKWTPTPAPTEQGKSAFLPFAIGASMGCWKTVYEALDGMDNSFRASQDVEFSWRAQLEGYTLGFDPEVRVDYRLRSRLRPLMAQSFRLGYGSTMLRGVYRPRGCPPVHLSKVVLAWIELAVRNPLVPVVITRLPRGLWVRAVWLRAGELRGGFGYRAFTW